MWQVEGPKGLVEDNGLPRGDAVDMGRAVGEASSAAATDSNQRPALEEDPVRVVTGIGTVHNHGPATVDSGTARVHYSPGPLETSNAASRGEV